MNEIDAIVRVADELLSIGNGAVLATVVRVRGSSYRRPGARMLLRQDGSRIGSISGGCLEGDLCRKAWWLTDAGRTPLLTYDTDSGDDAVREFGLGCNGIVDVLLERLSSSSARETLRFLRQCREAREAGSITHSIDLAANTLTQRTFATSHALALCSMEADVLCQEESQIVVSGSTLTFHEYVAPAVELFVFGAGYDAVPLMNFASALGWRVTVADARPATAAFRYPGFERVLAPAEVKVTPRSAAVLMTHSYAQDRDLLSRLLPAGLRYIGVLGPRHRTEQLFADLGISSAWEAVHAPAGLDLGGSSPETIALSITAEIQAVLSKRAGGMLRARSGPIYDPVFELAGR